MARNALFLKHGTYFYADSQVKTHTGLLLRKVMIKELRAMGFPAVDPCCTNEDNVVPLGYNTATGQDVVWSGGAWVPVETASGASTTTTTSTTTTVAPTTTSTTTTVP